MRGGKTMILKRAKINNFKQFEGEHTLEFNTDGKVTVIYGYNGYGKTRLHSFFYWLLYGNDRDGEAIYNKPSMRRSFQGDTVDIRGELEFEHNGRDHHFVRETTYKKGSNRVIKSNNFVRLRRADEYGNYQHIDEPELYIKDVLPEELSDYFFFDGEGMANELLGEKTGRNHKELKEAVNTIFGLKLYENAMSHIGTIDRKNNAIYELSRRKKDTNGKYKASTYQKFMTDKAEERDTIKQELEKDKKEKAEKQARKDKLSEQIGQKDLGNKLNAERDNLKKENDRLQKRIDETISKTGKLIGETLSYYIVSKNIKNVQDLITRKIDENYVSGLDSRIINNILKKDNCICGNHISATERENLHRLLNMLPPHSYSSIFYDYKAQAEQRLEGSKEAIEQISNIIENVTNYYDDINNNNERIEEIDSELSRLENIQQLVQERKELEKHITQLEEKMDQKNAKISELNTLVKSAEKKYREALKNNEANREITEKIEFLETCRQEINKRYEEYRNYYHKQLESNIREMIDKMLSVKREIQLNDNYTLTVSDKFGSTSLSAGQAAIISFAYIGGILNTLKNLNVKYVSQAYPLVLDAPLSHLDDDHIKNVFQHLPQFADQIIIFSKEQIDNMVEEDNSPYKYQIKTNAEANKSIVEEYKGEEYFIDQNVRRIQ